MGSSATYLTLEYEKQAGNGLNLESAEAGSDRAQMISVRRRVIFSPGGITIQEGDKRPVEVWLSRESSLQIQNCEQGCHCQPPTPHSPF
jgi:hypothetical protein